MTKEVRSPMPGGSQCDGRVGVGGTKKARDEHAG